MRERSLRLCRELLALAKEEGYELSDEQLSAVSGGWRECEQDTNSGPY